ANDSACARSASAGAASLSSTASSTIASLIDSVDTKPSTPKLVSTLPSTDQLASIASAPADAALVVSAYAPVRGTSVTWRSTRFAVAPPADAAVTAIGAPSIHRPSIASVAPAASVIGHGAEPKTSGRSPSLARMVSVAPAGTVSGAVGAA